MKKKISITIDEVLQSACGHLNPHLAGYTKTAAKNAQKTGENMQDGRSKYGSKKMEVDGILFDSKREASRYLELKMLQVAGLITELRLQVPYELNEGGTHSYKYIADFVYRDSLTGLLIVEDAKGYKTVEYKKKRRLMRKIHGIIIKES